MKIVILIHQITQEKYAYSEWAMMSMIEYIFTFKMVNTMWNSDLKIAARSTPLLGRIALQFAQPKLTTIMLLSRYNHKTTIYIWYNKVLDGFFKSAVWKYPTTVNNSEIHILLPEPYPLKYNTLCMEIM